jgi:hypothetical protein
MDFDAIFSRYRVIQGGGVYNREKLKYQHCTRAKPRRVASTRSIIDTEQGHQRMYIHKNVKYSQLNLAILNLKIEVKIKKKRTFQQFVIYEYNKQRDVKTSTCLYFFV